MTELTPDDMTDLERKIMQLRSGGGGPIDAETVADTFAVDQGEAQIALEALEHRDLIESPPPEYKFVKEPV